MTILNGSPFLNGGRVYEPIGLKYVCMVCIICQMFVITFTDALNDHWLVILINGKLQARSIVVQWVIGLFTFMAGGASQTNRVRMLPWHICWGRAIFYTAVCAALTGFIEKATFLRLTDQHEARVLNFTGLSVLLFGIFVDLSVALARYI